MMSMRFNLYSACFIILGICFLSINNEIISGLVSSLRPSSSQQSLKTTDKTIDIFNKGINVNRIRYLMNNNDFNNLSKSLSEMTKSKDNTKDDDNIDDFSRKDQICINYIEKFLGGATDTKDECEGALNAYSAAQCSDPLMTNHEHLNLDKYFEEKRNISPSSPSSTPPISNIPTKGPGEDDVLIDDYVENWECCTAIHSFYNNHCHQFEDITESLLAYVIVMVICIGVKSLIARHNIHWLPESAGCILVGAFAGGLMRLRSDNVEDIYFSENLLMVVLLPPIIFCAALKINKQAFRLHLIPIMMYAFLGTLLSSFLTGLAVYKISNAHNPVQNIPLLEALIFGALISSIDPVVILNILESAGIKDDNTLYITLFGESILNDAVAIVLFDTLVTYLGDQDIDTTSDEQFRAISAILNFLLVLIGSLSIGLFSGIVSNFFFTCISGTLSPVIEVSIFTLWAMIPYYICNLLHLSGIVALVAAGFFMDMYIIGSNHSHVPESTDNHDTYMLLPNEGNSFDMNGGGTSFETDAIPPGGRRGRQSFFSRQGQLSDTAKKHSLFVVEVVSTLAETSIFAYLGAFLFSSNYIWGWKLNLTAVIACVGSRTIMIMIVSFITNLLEKCKCAESTNTFMHNVQMDNESSEHRNRTDQTISEDSHWTGTTTSTKYIMVDCKMQIALIFAGLRGAVSLALVQSIPLYNIMTKTGTLFKPELKSMTSTSIIFTVFLFGGGTRKFLAWLGFLDNDNQSDLSTIRSSLAQN